MDQAFADRRLIKMVLSRFTGGLVEARNQYSAEGSPPLLIVEALGDAAAMTAALDSLAEVCVAGTNLILLGKINDISLYRELTRRGVSDYLVLPTEPLRLIDAVLELYRDPGKRPAGQVIAFIGAKGGCGNSAVAQNTAYQLSTQGNTDVVLLDLDLPFGSADLAFGVETAHGVHTVLNDPERIDDSFLQRFAAKYGEQLHLLAAPGSVEFDSLLSSAALDVTLNALRQQAKFVVLDVPRVWCDWVRRAVHAADHVVITAMADLPSVRNTRNLVDFLAARRALDQPPLLVLNRVGASRKTEVASKDFGASAGLSVAVEIIEDTAVFGQATALGKMVAEVGPRSKAAEGIRALALRLSGPPVKSAAKVPAKDKLAVLMHRLTGKG